MRMKTSRSSAWPAFCSPTSGRPLELRNNAWVSLEGNESFPHEAGISNFVGDDGYAEHFGWQWNRFPRTQLDSYTGLQVSEVRLQRCIGSELWSRLAGMQVLECGCGAGRFTEVLLSQKSVVTSIDLSSAVQANSRNFPPSDVHRIAKCDIVKLPFSPRQFDLVLCLGVVQHTPNPEATIAKLYEQVRPGGMLVIDHYTHERGRWSSVKPLVRAWLKRQPPQNTLSIIEGLVDRFLPWHKRFRSVYPLWFLLCRVSPIVTYYRLMPELSDSLQREWALLDSHDSLTDWYKHLRTESQIRATVENLGLQNIWSATSGNGIEARGTRPLAG